MSLSLRLPSGTRVRVRRLVTGAPRADDVVDGVRLFAGRALAVLRSGDVRVEREDGVALDVLALQLRDYHALREVLGRIGAIAVAPAELVCRNCDRGFTVDLAREPPEELADRLEDPPEEEWRATRTVRLASGMAGKLRGRPRPATLREVTVDEARAYWAELVGTKRLHLGPSLVKALGVVRFAEATSPGPIARELAGTRDWELLEETFESLAYDPRLLVARPCPHCGAIHELAAPYDREGGGRAEPLSRRLPPVLASAAAFEKRAHEIGAAVYAELGVRRVALRVEPGVPDVDDAGEPLLGSYQPGAIDVHGDEFLVTVYYRSFEKMWREDGPYDVDAELHETIEHELTHHLHHLAGHDPLDEEERREVRADLERTYGKVAVRRAERRAIVRVGVGVVALLGLVAGMLFLLDRLGVLR